MAKHLNKRRNNIVCIICTREEKNKQKVYEIYENSSVDVLSDS